MASPEMTAAAEDCREELECLLRQQRIPPRAVVEILGAADAYAKAFRHRRPPKPPSPPKPPAVHWPLVPGRPACRPDDHPFSVQNWAAAGSPAEVTCGHCRKTRARQEAAR